MNKKSIHNWYTSNTTPDASVSSVLNLINPLSALLPGKDYVPAWLVEAFKGSKLKRSDKNAVKTAQLVAKIAAGSLAFGLGAMGLRALMYTTDKDTFAVNKTPAKDIGKLYLKPTEAPIDVDDALYKGQESDSLSNIDKSASFTVTALPLLAVILASGIGAKKADQFFDAQKIRKLKASQLELLRQKNLLALLRIKLSRGIRDRLEKQLLEEDILKSASLHKKALTDLLGAGAGVLALVTFLLGRQAGKYLHDNINLETLKFKAYKKGLLEYNKARAFEQDLQGEALDPELVAYLNSNLDKKKNKKQLEQVSDQQTLKELLI